ncbi:hypothetical protein FGO68_gene13102 [Halteria grandinella]|uniref:Uncharacterized protein n=1 Tax=Halteria grandinella TaxID=5974 RepID=A0A8J8NBG8_HALGN|nr:hypothetical protein FGO68_gene13102 [Halteria grandinella]
MARRPHENRAGTTFHPEFERGLDGDDIVANETFVAPTERFDRASHGLDLRQGIHAGTDRKIRRKVRWQLTTQADGRLPILSERSGGRQSTSGFGSSTRRESRVIEVFYEIRISLSLSENQRV